MAWSFSYELRCREQASDRFCRLLAKPMYEQDANPFMLCGLKALFGSRQLSPAWRLAAQHGFRRGMTVVFAGGASFLGGSARPPLMLDTVLAFGARRRWLRAPARNRTIRDEMTPTP